MHAMRTPDVRVLWGALFAVGTLLISTHANADSGSGQGTGGALIGDALYSNDSDRFDELRTSAGYLFPNNWGVGASVTYFHAPDWTASGRGLYGMYRQVNAQQTIDARLGVMDTNGYTTAVGMLDYQRHVTASTALGVSAERDVVDSIVGLQRGLTYNSLAFVLDHQFTPRFSVGAVLGGMWFSDDNARPLLRTRWNYELLANSGFNAYVKTRTYYDSRPYLGDYYSPRWLSEYSGGLSWRTALSDIAVFFVSADIGRQNTADSANNIWSARIGLENLRRRSVQWRIAVETTNNRASSFVGGGEGYRYTSVTGRLLFPFQ